MKEEKKYSADKSLLTRFVDVAILVAFICMALLTFAFLIQSFLYERFVLGTEIGGINVSGKTPSEAQKLLEKEIEKYNETRILISLDGTEKKLDATTLGITFLTDQTLEKASEENKKIAGITKYVKTPTEKIKTPLRISINQEILTETLTKEFDLEKIQPANAWYEFDKQWRLQVTESKEGLDINKEALTKTLKEILGELKKEKIEIELIKAIPILTTAELERQRPAILAALNHRMALEHPQYRNKWTLSLINNLDWVKFSTKQKITFAPTNTSLVIEGFPEIKSPAFSTQTYITIEIDQEKLNEFIDAKMSKYLDSPVENVNIYKNEEGQIIIEGRGDNGKQIKRNFFKTALELAIDKKISTVPIPVQEIEPTITVSKEIEDLGIKEIVAVGHTTFYGSPLNRIYNIGVGATKLNGTIIKKGETFSFNKTIGAVNGATGYLMELVIKPEGTIPEFGGGLCQDSTTVYRAALFAGLPIAERHQHSYAVAYYSQVLGHGLDATVYMGGADLKFVNDTEGDILMQVYTKNKHEIFVVLYGTKDSRTVEMEGPYISNKTHPSEVVYQEVETLPIGIQKKIENAHIGFNALWYRHLTMPNGEQKKEEIVSKYRTMPAKVLVGTGN